MDLHGNADCATYLHRIGRTGRFGKHGLAINLVQVLQNYFKTPPLNYLILGIWNHPIIVYPSIIVICLLLQSINK